MNKIHELDTNEHDAKNYNLKFITTFKKLKQFPSKKPITVFKNLL